jgi:hypothetical protein
VEEDEPPALALVGESADDAAASGRVDQQPGDRGLHVDLDPAVDAVILEGADHLEPGAIADVCEARITVASEVALQDAAVRRPVEERAPGLELAHAFGSLAGVELRHPGVVHVLAAAHGVREVGLPAVPVVDVGERGRDAAFGHHRVRLAEQRLRDQPDRRAARRSLDRGAQAGAARPDHQDVDLDRAPPLAQSSLQSVQVPIEQRRM